jgi:hypothetical protein
MEDHLENQLEFVEVLDGEHSTKDSVHGSQEVNLG